MAIQADKEKNRELLAKIKERSDDDYEKNITFISAGTLVLSMGFIEKVVNLNAAIALWILITSWVLLSLTLFANLISHQLSSNFHEKTIGDYDADDPKINEKVDKRNKIIRIINWCTTLGLGIGILFLILFCSINTYHMAKIEKKIITNPLNYEKKGRTIIKPKTTVNNGGKGGQKPSNS